MGLDRVIIGFFGFDNVVFGFDRALFCTFLGFVHVLVEFNKVKI